jgi:hypothetical protein
MSQRNLDRGGPERLGGEDQSKPSAGYPTSRTGDERCAFPLSAVLGNDEALDALPRSTGEVRCAFPVGAVLSRDEIMDRLSTATGEFRCELPVTAVLSADEIVDMMGVPVDLPAGLEEWL